MAYDDKEINKKKKQTIKINKIYFFFNIQNIIKFI